MKVILTIKMDKGITSTKKDIDRTVDVVLSMGTELEKRMKGFKIGEQ